LQKFYFFIGKAKIFKVYLIERKFLHYTLDGNEPSVDFVMVITKRAGKDGLLNGERAI